MRAMRLQFLLAALMIAAPAPAAAQSDNSAHCDEDKKPRDDDDPRQKKCERLALTVETDLDFGRVVVLGGGRGRITIDLGTGLREVSGELDPLGGIAVAGRAVVTGTPRAFVRVRLPLRVTLRDPAGGTAALTELATDLSPRARLDRGGRLEFGFTGTLLTDGDTLSGGELRARVPIRVDYD